MTIFASCSDERIILLAQFPIRIATSKEKESKTKSPLEYVLYSADFTIGDLRLSQACMGIWRGCAILFIRRSTLKIKILTNKNVYEKKCKTMEFANHDDVGNIECWSIFMRR